ncbi:TonB-dependent receptor [uncultured Muribaculum sp.]|uniref:TonB-dependent receptor n=2 Tax=uncultured Muribaculum sp. TaxID=1918613 RepID=UPI00266FC26F|nr:TonB-dependent receptor [uncultured Muribaculum sp.]
MALLAMPVYGQQQDKKQQNTVALSGSLIDSEGEPLIEATVKLLSARDSQFVKGTTTNFDGVFKMAQIKPGRYILTVSYIGYEPLDTTLRLGRTANVKLNPILMRSSSIMLKEAVVHGVKTPIKVMEDTVEYNADSYHTQPNAVVEDLLKRLPGVEVGTDGAITANGKTVSKILIDGKEFFSDDPQVASKNLPANMIEKLQVVDRKSDMARLTGVDDGEDETVINLTFKRGMNQGWFGTAEAGYGTDDRYMASFNVNRFWNGNQVTLLGNFNNTNQLGFTDSNGNRFRRFGGNNGITESRALGLNFNVGKEDIIRIGGDVMWSNTDRKSITRQEREYLFSDYSTFAKINKYSRDRGNNFRGDFRVLWKPDSFNTLEVRPNFSLNFNKSRSTENTDYFNRYHEHASHNATGSNSDGDSYEFGGRIIYSHSFKNHRGRSFSLSSNYRYSNVIENESSFSDFIRLLEDDPDNEMDIPEKLDQYNDNKTWSNQIMGQFTWTEPLGDVSNGNYLTFSYRANYRWNNADKLVYNLPDDYDLGIYPPVTIGPDGSYIPVEPDPKYSNRYRNNYFNQQIRAGYRKVTQNANLEVGLALVPQMSKSIFLDNADKNIDRWVWNYAPFLRYRYKFSKQSSIQVNYRGQSSQPSMTQLQPVLDVSNPTNQIQGNPNLDPSFNHNLMVRYQNFNMESQRSVMLMANIQMTQNAIISATQMYENGSRLTSYMNVNGVWNGRLMNMFSMPFRNKKWSFSNHIFTNASRTIGYNNNQKNASLTFMVSENPGITFRPDNFELELRPRYSLQTTHNTVQVQGNQTVHSYGGRFDGSYYTSWGLTLQTDINYSATSGYAAGYNTRTWLWNATLSQQFLKSKSLTLAVKVFDLLNQRSNIRRTVTANYIDDIEYNSLTRYFMVTLSYRFNSFGKGNRPDGFEERGPGGRHGFGGPPPGHGRR